MKYIHRTKTLTKIQIANQGNYYSNCTEADVPQNDRAMHNGDIQQGMWDSLESYWYVLLSPFFVWDSTVSLTSCSPL